MVVENPNQDLVPSLGLGQNEEDDGQEEDEDEAEGKKGAGEAEGGLHVGEDLEGDHQQQARPGPRQTLDMGSQVKQQGWEQDCRAVVIKGLL